MRELSGTDCERRPASQGVVLGLIPERCSCGQQLLIVLAERQEMSDAIRVVLGAATALGAHLVVPANGRRTICPSCGQAADGRVDPLMRLFEKLASIDA